MSLIELLVGVGLFVLIGLLFNTVMLKVHQGYANVSDRVARETEAADLSFNLKHFLSNAVELTEANKNVLLPTAFSAKRGYIAPYDLVDNWTPVSGVGTPRAMALYFRDTQKTLGPLKNNDSDRFLPTGLFFIPPTVDHYGMIAFNFGSPGATTLTGAANQLQSHFGRIVDFKIAVSSDTNRANIKKVKSLLITFTTRSYKSKGTERRTWCPPSKMSMAVCETTGTYSDYTWNVNVVLRNNTLGESSDRRQENTALTPVRLEPAPTRFVEGTYFLVPELPLESMKR
jgi:hypothetical protein